jgi:hypothetical protein
MSSVHQFISQLKDQQTSARYEPKANGRAIANLVPTAGGSSLLTASNECVIPAALAIQPGATVLSVGQMAPSDRNRSGKDHNICVFAPSTEGQKGAITTVAYGQPTPDVQYAEQVKAHEDALAKQAEDPTVVVPNVCLFAGHFTKANPLGTEWQIQYLVDKGEVLIQLLAW